MSVLKVLSAALLTAAMATSAHASDKEQPSSPIGTSPTSSNSNGNIEVNPKTLSPVAIGIPGPSSSVVGQGDPKYSEDAGRALMQRGLPRKAAITDAAILPPSTARIAEMSCSGLPEESLKRCLDSFNRKALLEVLANNKSLSPTQETFILRELLEPQVAASVPPAP